MEEFLEAPVADGVDRVGVPAHLLVDVGRHEILDQVDDKQVEADGQKQGEEGDRKDDPELELADEFQKPLLTPYGVLRS
jgi:hypothetical protein